MSNTISAPTGPTPAPERPASREAQPGAGGAAAGHWHAAFQQAMERDFDGWFQAPPARHDAGMASWPMPGAGVAGGAMIRPTGLPLHSHALPASPRAPAHDDADAAAAGAPALHDAASRSTEGRLTADAEGSVQAGVPIAPAQRAAPSLTASGRGPWIASALSALVAAEVEWVPATDTPSAPRPQAGPGMSAEARFERAVGPGQVDGGLDDATETGDKRATSAADEREPLRVHAQWSDDGVQLWLGADIDGMASVGAVLSQLQQAVAAQGTRLLRVVCNGREMPLASPAGARVFDAELPSGITSEDVDRFPRLHS